MLSFQLLLQTSVMAANSVPVTVNGTQTFSRDEVAGYLEEKGVPLSSPSEWRIEQRERATRLIRTFYRDRGFPFVSAGALDSQSGIILKVSEGPRARLRTVKFKGNSRFSESELRHYFKFGEWYSESTNVEALDRIKSSYRNHGFVKVSLQTRNLSKLEYKESALFGLPFLERLRNGVLLEISVSEGPEYRIGRVSCSEGVSLDKLELPRKGDLYRDRDLVALQESIESCYSRQGYLMKSLRILRSFRDEAARVDLTVLAETYPELLIRRIEFCGNENYPDLFYRRELEIQEGRLLEPAALERSLQKLASTGTLKSVKPEDFELDIDEGLQEVSVLLNLHEKGRYDVGYSIDPRSGNGLTGNLFVSVVNLLRLGEKLGIEVNYGDQTSGIGLRLAARYLLGTDVPASLALGFFKRHTGFNIPGLDDELRELLGFERQGFTGLFSYRLKGRTRAGFSATVEDVTRLGSTTRRFDLEPFWETSSGTDGESLRLSNGISLHSGDDLSWNLRPAAEASARLFRSPTGDRSLLLRGRAMRGLFFGSQSQLSDRLFFRDGELRGFQSGSTGPWGWWNDKGVPLGGDALLACSIEYPYTLTDYLEAVPYFDLGWSGTYVKPPGYDPIESANRLVRASTGIEWKARPVEDLPQVGLGLDWNPLRLDFGSELSSSLADLRESGFRIRFTLDP